MRRFIVMSLLAGVMACNAGRGTAPAATGISVRVRDDRGQSAGRNQVVVTFSATRVNASTQSDGTADIPMADAGTYTVSLIPRAGFVVTQSLSKTVTVTANARTVVEFTLYRSGVPQGDPPPTGEGCVVLASCGY